MLASPRGGSEHTIGSGTCVRTWCGGMTPSKQKRRQSQPDAVDKRYTYDCRSRQTDPTVHQLGTGSNRIRRMLMID
jgi:hypothetical protein